MSNDERIAVLETTISHIDAGLSDIKRALVQIDSRFESLNAKVDSRFDKLNDRMWTLFFWMMGGFAGILAVIAHGFKWI